MAIEQFECCNKQFKNRSTFNQHEKTHSKPHKCNVCQRGFALRADLNRHILKVHRPRSEEVICSVCSRKFSRKDNLQRHLRVHDRPGAQVETRHHHKTVNLEHEQSSISFHAVTGRLLSLGYLDSAILPRCDTLIQAASTGNIAVLQAAIDAGADINGMDENHMTPLSSAAKAGQIETIEFLLHHGASTDLDHVGRGQGPLEVALHARCVDAVAMLLHASARPKYMYRLELDLAKLGSSKVLQQIVKSGKHIAWSLSLPCILAYASRFGKLDLVKEIFDTPGVTVDITQEIFLRGDFSLGSALHEAASGGSTEVLRFFLSKKDTNVNLRNSIGQTPICLATKIGRLQILETLLRHPRIDITITDKYANNLLHLACRHNRVTIVKHLLFESRIDINARDFRGRTPLHLAATKGCVEIVQLLLMTCKIDISTKDLLVSIEKAALNCKWATVKALLDHEEGICCTSHTCPEPQDNHQLSTTIRRFLKHAEFEDINKIFLDTAGRWGLEGSLIHYVIFRGDVNALKTLVEYDHLDVNLCKHWRGTPLGLAIEGRRVEVVQILLLHPNIDVNLVWWGGYRGRYEVNALSLARAEGLPDIVNLLLQHGVKDLDTTLPSSDIPDEVQHLEEDVDEGLDASDEDEFETRLQKNFDVTSEFTQHEAWEKEMQAL